MFSGVTLKKYGSSCVFVLIAVLLTTLIDLYVLDYGISYREVIVTLVALAGFSVFVAGDRGLKVGLVFLVMTFGLGYRTMDVTPSLHVHPSELVLWGLLALPILQPAIWRRSEVKIWLPRWLILFIPFWIWAWMPGLSAGLSWGDMFNEFRNFSLLVPLFIVTEIVMARRARIKVVFMTQLVWVGWDAVIKIIRPKQRLAIPVCGRKGNRLGGSITGYFLS